MRAPNAVTAAPPAFPAALLAQEWIIPRPPIAPPVCLDAVHRPAPVPALERTSSNVRASSPTACSATRSTRPSATTAGTLRRRTTSFRCRRAPRSRSSSSRSTASSCRARPWTPSARARLRGDRPAPARSGARRVDGLRPAARAHLPDQAGRGKARRRALPVRRAARGRRAPRRLPARQPGATDRSRRRARRARVVVHAPLSGTGRYGAVLAHARLASRSRRQRVYGGRGRRRRARSRFCFRSPTNDGRHLDAGRTRPAPRTASR